MRPARSLFAFLIATALVLAACAPAGTGPAATGGTAATATPAPQAVQTLRIATSADESSWNPYTYISGYPGWTVLLMQFDTLMAFNVDSVPEPWLAKDVQASADSKVWTLTLESGVKWHDGQPFTAEDVKFTIEYFQKNIHGRFSTPLRDVEKVEIQGTDKLVITIKAPKPGWRSQALADVPMLPKHVWETVTEPKKFTDLKGNTGTGPYKMVEFRQDQFYRFEANADYFKGKPLVNEIVMPVVKEAASAFASLKAGELDTTTRALQPELIKDFEATPGMKIVRGADFASSGLWINVERPALGRKEVRQAISMAIDRQRLVDTVFLGYATPGSPGFIHPSNPFFNPDLKAEYDVAKANQMLDQLGAARGADGIRVLDGTAFKWEVLVSATAGPLRLREAELIGQMLKDIGVELKPRVVESAAWTALAWPDFDVRKGRNYDFSLTGWSAPTQFEAGRMVEQIHSDPLIGSLNVYGLRDPAGDRLAEQLRDEGDPDKRKQLGMQMQAYIADTLPIITTLYPDGIYVYKEASFDGWRFQKGLGIFQKHSFLPR